MRRVIGVLALMCGIGCSETQNILLSHGATKRAIVNREVEFLQLRICVKAPCPSGPAVWSGASDHRGRIAVPKALLAQSVVVEVRGFRAVQGMPLKSALKGGFVLELQSLPAMKGVGGKRSAQFDRAPDATVKIVEDAGGAAVANRKVRLREAEYCESPAPECGPGEEIWGGTTDGQGMVQLSKWTASLASVFEVEGYAPDTAWNLRTALRNGKTEWRVKR